MHPLQKAFSPILISALLLQSCAGEAERSSRLSVIGEASVDTSPDTAVIVVSVVTQSRQALAAQQENARITTAIDSALSKRFGAKAKLKSRGYSLQPQQRYDAKSMPSIIGYEARNSVEIALADLDRVGEAVDAATAAGANSVEGVSFELRNVDSTHARALATASQRAMAKARSMAEAVGATITRVVEAGEIDALAQPPYPYAGNLAPQETRADGAATYATPIRPGTLRHQTVVRMVVEIEAKK